MSHTINYKTLAEETPRDEHLTRIKSDLLKCENNNTELYLKNSIIFNGRVLVPMSLQQAVLSKFRHPQAGVIKTKQLSRQYL